MVEQLIGHALESSGFAAAAFLVAIVALWRTLRSAVVNRVAALELAVADCNKKHAACEKRNRNLSAAMIDLLTGKTNEAMAKCQTILQEEDDDA